MSIENTSILPEKTTRLAYVFIYICFDWLVIGVEKEQFLLCAIEKGHGIDDVIIARSASDSERSVDLTKKKKCVSVWRREGNDRSSSSSSSPSS